MNMFFWLFEARHNPTTAPLVLYMNGGPGANDESLIFGSDGPCTFNYNDTEPSLNPHSFNEFANMLYLDQPLATGFSHGNTSFNSTVVAEGYVWKFLQAFLAEFKNYQGREFGIMGVSYGGHYRPSLASEILEQNSAIGTGSRQGTYINVTTLGLINAYMDARIQTRENIVFARDNDYRPLIDFPLYLRLLNDFDKHVKPTIEGCQSTLDIELCRNASDKSLNITEEIAMSASRKYADFDSLFDIRKKSHQQRFTLGRLRHYLNDTTIQHRINAKPEWRDLGGRRAFSDTGDESISFTPEIERALEAGIAVVLMTGDADYQCNWRGISAVAKALEWPGQEKFNLMALEPYEVHGALRGSYKVVDNLGMVIVAESGHNVPEYQPEVALQIFQQMLVENLSST